MQGHNKEECYVLHLDLFNDKKKEDDKGEGNKKEGGNMGDDNEGTKAKNKVNDFQVPKQKEKRG